MRTLQHVARPPISDLRRGAPNEDHRWFDFVVAAAVTSLVFGGLLVAARHQTETPPVPMLVFGHGWPESSLLGMAPWPTTTVPFGVFLLAVRPFPKRLLIVPVVWAILAPPAAMHRGVYEDLGLLLVGVGAGVLVLVGDRRTHSKPHHPALAVSETRHD